MASDQTTPSGPDLARDGVPLGALDDGTPFLGHAGDDAIILVKDGETIHAVGAQCTHYGGPLAEGLVLEGPDGPTVRCPWHHACFSLRTGEALRAPALNPLPCWTVERRDGRAYVGAKRETDPIAQTGAPRRDDTATQTFVIVGAGAAGHAAAEMLRRHGFAGRLVLLGRDDKEPVDRPNLSKEYLSGEAPEEWIALRPREFYDEHRIELRTGAAVERVDVAARTVTVAGGEALGWDRLLLATGASPVRLDTPGAELPHVRLLRTYADARALIAAAEGATRAVVLGASFIGLEVAASLRHRGVEVHVAAPEKRPLERVMGAALGDAVRRWHEEHGVVFHLETKAARIEPDAVTLESGVRLAADLVVVGVGVRPELALAEQAGLAMDRGVLVDERLETSAPGVFAAGDIARWPDPHTGERVRVEHWVVAQRQGQTAARNMLGHGVAYDDAPFFWSAHYGTSIRYVGHAERWDAEEVDGDPAGKDGAVTLRRGGKALAVLTVGRDRRALEAAAAMERGDG